ncbi:MAG: HAMP domain-containing sensor histidine kinase [Opitutaceae bacterium]
MTKSLNPPAISTAAINEALLISGLHQHELTAEADKSNSRLAKEIAVRRHAETALEVANAQLAHQAAKLELLVAERTEKLRETVSELEGFSYSVAHDLRAPLRGMQGFAHLLLLEHAAELGPVAKGYLERISSSATRMDLLIQDVLNYTRISRTDAPLVRVDLDRLVRDIIATYPGWQAPQVAIKIEGTLPPVLGHEGLLSQSVSNLLSNAVKFVAAGVIPNVLIWAEEVPGSSSQIPWPAAGGKPLTRWVDQVVVRVWFENNGIGIDAKDRERVFQMFERLNPTDLFEGTGIGLTIARRAVERMGGRIGFESEPRQGSRFWVELHEAPRLPSGSPG